MGLISNQNLIKKDDRRVIIAIDIDYFFAQCEEVRNKALKGRPVVVCVYSGRTADSGAVSTSNYIARKLGIKSGMPIIRAKHALEKYDAAFLPLDKEHYECVSRKIMGALRDEADRFEKVSIDEAFLDVSERASGNFDIAKDTANGIKKIVLSLEGLTCSAGVAENKLLAKMSADLKKPDGLVVTRKEDESSFLEDLPVAKLPGVGPKIENRLHALGVRNVGELGRFDSFVLRREFGENLGPHLSEIARGIDNSPVEEREITQLSRIITLKKDAASFDSFRKEIPALATDLSSKLSRLNLEFNSIGIILITTELKTKNRTRLLENFSQSSEVISREAFLLFEDFFSNSDEIVRRIGIRVSGLKKIHGEDRSPSLTDYFSSN